MGGIEQTTAPLPGAWTERTAIAVLAVVAVLTLFAGLGTVPLFDKDEGAFSEASREMLESGDWVVPYLDGEPRYQKPILIYWLQSASLAVFGVNEFGARFPSAVAGLLWAALTYGFVRGRRGVGTAFWAAFILLTAVQTSLIMKAAISDSVLNLFIAASMFAWYRYFESRDLRWLYLTAAAMALGFLTKGPVAIGIPAAVSFLFCASQRNFMLWVRTVTNPIGWVIFLMIALPWYVVAYIKEPIVVEKFLLSENLGRATGAMDGHGGPVWYYVPVLLLGFLPFTALTVTAIGRVLRGLPRSIHLRDRQEPDTGLAPLQLYGFIWFALVFVVFSLVATKLPHYVIYGYTPLIVLMAERMERPPALGWFSLPAAGVLGVFLALPWLVEPIANAVDDPVAADILLGAKDEFGLGYRIVVGTGFVAMLALPLMRNLGRPARVFVAGLVFVGAVSVGVMPAAGRILQSPVVEAAAYADEHDLEVAVYRMPMPSFSFHRERISPPPVLEPGRIVFGQKAKVAKIGEVETLYEKNGLVLARIVRVDDANE